MKEPAQETRYPLPARSPIAVSVCAVSSSGFTLLEVMIALVLASLVLITLTAGSGYVFREWGRDKDVLGDRLDQGLLLLRLERALAGAYPHLYRREEGEKYKKTIFFEGEKDSLSWVSTVAPGGINGLGAWRIVYEEGRVLVFLVPACADDPGPRLDQALPVAEIQATGLTIRYLEEKPGLPGKKHNRTWRAKWSAKERRQLPAAVELVLSGNGDLEGGRIVLAAISANEHRTLKPKAGP